MSLALVALIAAATVAVGWAAVFGGRLPAAYGTRSCQGKGWRRQFPEAVKADIRDFLSLFVSSFAFNDDQKLKLNPDDEILRIYRALYPSPLGRLARGTDPRPVVLTCRCQAQVRRLIISPRRHEQQD